MFALTRLLPLRRLLFEEAPALAAAFLIAELCYKFRSFTLECLAFLATWYALDLLVHLLRSWLGRADARREGLAGTSSV